MLGWPTTGLSTKANMLHFKTRSLEINPAYMAVRLMKALRRARSGVGWLASRLISSLRCEGFACCLVASLGSAARARNWCVSTGDVRCSGSAFAQWAMAGQIFCAKRRKFGGDRRDRTDDLKLAKLALSQLSYVPAVARKASYGVASPPRNELIAVRERLACRAEARGSQARLRPVGFGAAAYSRFASVGWWAWEDLNLRPHAYQARALTN